MSVEKTTELMKIFRDVGHGPFEAANDDDTGGILRYVPDTSSPDPLEHTLDHELKQKIRAALDLLTPQEELIIQLRFGLGGKERHTLKQIGEIVALSRERVRQIERKILERLQTTTDLREMFRCLTASN